MAGTVTVVETDSFGVQKIKWSWTSDASGDATLITAFDYFGEVLALFTDPGATAPTDNYDVTILDSEGFDVLKGAGVDRDTANNEIASPATKSVAFGKLTLTVANAGNAKVGVAILYLQGKRKP